MEILRLENLSKYYTSQSSVVMGLTNINLSFSTGEFVAITGESGSGKSTLAHTIGGILPYESGEMYINGKPTSHYDDSDRERYRRDEIGFISQNYGILEGNTVLENILCTLRFCSIEGEEAEKTAFEVLREVDLLDFRSRRAGKLSSGQKQRLSIARALAKPSKILIADEPTGNLDRENSEKVIELLKRASRDRLVLLITHEFEEAKDAATRKLVIQDGSVVSDIKLREPKEDAASASPAKKEGRKKENVKLTLYTTSLSLRAHPIFSATICLLLAFTSFIVFAFLGTFTVALDDSDTKIYTPDAFYNGDPERIVLMRSDGADFTEEDYNKILSARYTDSIERWGYVNDLNYYYVPGEDYAHFSSEKNDTAIYPESTPDGPLQNLSGLRPDRLNFDPYKFEVVASVEIMDTKKFVRTLPYTGKDIVTSGRACEGAYEVVSADPRLKVGDRVLIYVRNLAEWNKYLYISLVFDVVGETSFGEGLYFSDTFASILSNSTKYYKGYPYKMLNESIILAPYAEGQLGLEGVTLNEGEVCISEDFAEKRGVGKNFNVKLYNDEMKFYDVRIAHLAGTEYSKTVFINENDFARLHDFAPSDQISLYIKDYAYLDRVTDALGEMGYLTISPFRSGSTYTDPTLAQERQTTLYICLGALLVAVLLQLILLRAIFSSIFGYFKLMCDIGLTSKTVYSSLALMLAIYTVIGEIIGAGIILLLNYLRVEQIVGIFKYFELSGIILLFAVHIISVIAASALVIHSAKKAVFNNAKHTPPDLDINETEDSAIC